MDIGKNLLILLKNLTDDFKFTKKEIYGMNVQGYDKEDEYKGE